MPSLTTQGYKRVWNKEKKKYELEHRVKMEEFLNRKLSIKEHVHHINGIKTDNRIENLIILTIQEHGGFHGREYFKDKKIFCSVCGRPQQAKGLCNNHYQQKRYKRIRPPKTSKYKGVSFDKLYQKWAVNLYRDGATIFRKKFLTEREAGKAVKSAIEVYNQSKYDKNKREI